MKRVRVRELSGAALDWAVAKALGWVTFPEDGEGRFYWYKDAKKAPFCERVSIRYFRPSIDWDEGGEIIREKGIDLRQVKQAEFSYYSYYKPEQWPEAEVIMKSRNHGPDRMLRVRNKPHPLHEKWMAKMSQGTGSTVVWSKEDFLSDTPLQAAMRCLVAYKMGAEIEIPEELYGK